MPTYGSYERENQGYSYQNSEEAGTGKLTDPNRVDYVDDSGHSAKVRDATITTENVFDLEDDSYRGVLHANNFFTRNEIDLFNKDYRFGVLNPYGAIGAAKEVLFLATGKNKAKATKSAIEEGVNHKWPVSALQMHKHGIYLCDEDAASKLEKETIIYLKDIERNAY